MAEKESNVFKAKLAEQAERYEEMAEFMKLVAKNSSGMEMTVEERNLLSVAYKNVIGARRAAWRIISSLEQKGKESGKESGKDHGKVETLKKYKETVEGELQSICDEILSLLEKDLIPNSQDNEARVFFHKMKGDYFRYLAEIAEGEKKEEAKKSALKAYDAAVEIAKDNLAATCPIRLGLFLNFSVFHYEINDDPKKACNIAKEAFDNAISDLDSLSEDSYKDSTLIMQLLRDNLTLWTSDTEMDKDGTKVEDIEGDDAKE
ncbi:uncharacterized protein [Pocillopora verrucosa]|uniref:uncharacterized protein n=1 Tax=Pocillopora verrucosa TaxID=203993 RepID=UPI002797BCC6|nr:uncharacterized protein LOC131768911 [Pocillopora verrucosa]